MDTSAIPQTAIDSLTVIRQFVKDMEFVWPAATPTDEDDVVRDITEIIDSWNLGEMAEGCFKYVNFGTVVAMVSLPFTLLHVLLNVLTSFKHFYGHVPSHRCRVVLGAITA